MQAKYIIYDGDDHVDLYHQPPATQLPSSKNHLRIRILHEIEDWPISNKAWVGGPLGKRFAVSTSVQQEKPGPALGQLDKFRI
ncbi:hypothetical protein TWF679_000732 [Orbilia oligospora]|uniref:Uncharacterized protein n=1 Tax=Orbilia oligospora TaxID=2813651 RepID=A0A8H8UX14_ORBOL|nr:hypothetical protein TWF679_000732 [Orbilia oligospora]